MNREFVNVGGTHRCSNGLIVETGQSFVPTEAELRAFPDKFVPKTAYEQPANPADIDSEPVVASAATKKSGVESPEESDARAKAEAEKTKVLADAQLAAARKAVEAEKAPVAEKAPPPVAAKAPTDDSAKAKK